MRTKVTALIAGSLALGAAMVIEAQTVPDFVCRGDEVVFIDHSRLTTSKHASTDIYRFTGGKLYISSTERDEYLYNDVRQVEPGRYLSGHKTIHFGLLRDTQFRNAIAVHTDSTSTIVLSLRCTRTAG